MFQRKNNTTQIVDFNNLPKHVAIIMDGNGRWAKQKMLPRVAGHRAGMSNVKSIIRMSSDIGIKYLTMYAFSTENWSRPKAEVGALMNLIVEFLTKEIYELHKKNVVFKTIGDVTKLPEPVLDIIYKTAEQTKLNTGMVLNIALNYGSRAEIVNAVKKIVKKVSDGKINIDDIDYNMISDFLDTAGQPDPDLLIRTSGEMRLSNYLLCQLAYAEFYFTPVYWPEFDEVEYNKALLEYQNRNRRYGGL